MFSSMSDLNFIASAGAANNMIAPGSSTKLSQFVNKTGRPDIVGNEKEEKVAQIDLNGHS